MMEIDSGGRLRDDEGDGVGGSGEDDDAGGGGEDDGGVVRWCWWQRKRATTKEGIVWRCMEEGDEEASDGVMLLVHLFYYPHSHLFISIESISSKCNIMLTLAWRVRDIF